MGRLEVNRPVGPVTLMLEVGVREFGTLAPHDYPREDSELLRGL